MVRLRGAPYSLHMMWSPGLNDQHTYRSTYFSMNRNTHRSPYRTRAGPLDVQVGS